MKISLFGYGQTTKALAKLHDFGPFDIYDDSFEKPSKDEDGNSLLPVKYFNPILSDLQIPSPGFPPTHKLIKKASNLISEYDFFYDAMPKSIWISGTNGKTTTTQMIAHLFKDLNIQTGGNIGTPLAKLDINSKLWILETSSFTLHYTKEAKPELYLLLPISKDHISWHKSYKNYIKAKLGVLSRLSEMDLAIIPKKYLDLIPSKAHIISYDDEYDLAKKLNINYKKISFKPPFLMDAIFALSAQKIILDKIDYDAINAFLLQEHKLEELKDSKNRLWVNDTKATNIDATIKALNKYKDYKIYLILGGDNKAVSLKPLFKHFKNLNIELFAIGKAMDEILTLAKINNIKAHKCHILKNALKLINELLSTDADVALLSPACASLDQFSSYIQRGQVFKDFIRAINV